MTARYFSVSTDGERTEWTRKQCDDYCFQFTNPIWDSVIRDLSICTNCWCTDCGCCIGCGDINADCEGDHGYHCAL